MLPTLLKLLRKWPYLLVAVTFPALAQVSPSPTRCNLNVEDWEQARCLLSPVITYGHIGSPRRSLPAPWQSLLGSHPRKLPTEDRFHAYLRHAGIRESDVGGGVDHPISQTAQGQSAHYFVIHDASVLLDAPRKRGFPAYINAKAWSDATTKSLASKKNAHVFIGRTGQSVTAVNFGEALITTKFEKTDQERLAGLFVGVENLQPRLRDGKGIDSVAPMPGFTSSQLKRLAVVYVAASLRAGHWLIPAFHAVLDNGIADAHDDPQHFDLARFSAMLNGVLREVDGTRR